MKMTLLGAPGAGKGTQAKVLSEKLGIPTISTGEILRAAISEGTDVGMQAKAFIDKGQLVPDDVIIGIVKERLAKDDCANGFILDGMPRTIPQAQALIDNGVLLDVALSLEVDDEEIVERMAGRRLCSKCGASFHTVSHPPKTAGVCDFCGGQLTTRADDVPETVKARLAVYHEQTEPLKDFYAEKGLLRKAGSRDGIAAVTKEVFRVLEIAE